jgi:hypothetical protein
MKIRIAFATTLALAMLAGTRPADAAVCTTTDGTQVMNALFEQLTPILNQAWPSVAVNNGLDPLKDVYDGSIKLSCKYGGDEVCGVQASSCKKMWAEVDVSSINGLAYLQFENVHVNTLKAADGTQACPYSSSASGGSYACSYSGSGTADAYLTGNSQISASIPKVKVKVKCNNFIAGDFTETLYSGSAKCYASKPKGNSTFDFCGGSCASGSVPATISYAAVDSLDLKVSDLKCDVSPDYSPASWIAEALVPALEDQIVDAITPALEDALNDLFAEYMPFPAKCGS